MDWMNKAIEKSRILFLDTVPLMRLLQMHPDYYPSISEILDIVYEDNKQLLVSSVTLYEISCRAYESGEGVLSRQYREFFEHSRNVRCCDVTSEVSVKAAELYAASQKTNHKLTENESLRLATAFVNGADCIVSECSAFRDATDIPAVSLNEI